MKKEIIDLFVCAALCIEQVIFLIFVVIGDFTQPAGGIMIFTFIVLIAYFSYHIIKKAATITKMAK